MLIESWNILLNNFQSFIFKKIKIISAPCVFLILCVNNLYADDLEQRKQDLEAQLIHVHEDQLRLAMDLNEHRDLLEKSSQDIDENSRVFKLAYDQHEEELKAFASKLQQVMYWKAKRKSNLFSTLGHKDHSAKSYLWKNILNQQQAVLKKQINNLDLLIKNAALLDEKKNDYNKQVIYQENLLNRVEQQKKEMENLLEELVLMQQEELKNKSSDLKSLAVPFNARKITPPLLNIKKRVMQNFLGASVFEARKGEAVNSMAEGTVIFADFLKGLGNVIMVEHGEGYLSVYGNCLKLSKKVGESVLLGEQIAMVGQSGQIGKEALYFEFRKDGQIIAPPSWDRFS